MKLNSTSLAKGASTDPLRVTSFGKAAVAYCGDLDGETLSMECSIDADNWSPFFPSEDATVQETYSNTTPSVRSRVFMLPGGIYVRWTMSNGAGTPADVYVLYDGENLKPLSSD